MPSPAAAGVFAPGHVGELTQYLPFELVDDVLELTGTVQRRLRDLPSRTGVYFLLALAMFPQLGYARVWGKLTAGLHGMTVPFPSEKALRDLRRRLGLAPMKALFEVVAGPLARPRTPGVCWGGLRTVAFDGCLSLKVPDTGPNRLWLGRIRYRHGFAGYPSECQAPPAGALRLRDGWEHSRALDPRPRGGSAAVPRPPGRAPGAGRRRAA